jgi:putative iron-dependent peroxidase
MIHYQTGIFQENSIQFYYLEYQLDDSNSKAKIKTALSKALLKQAKDLNIVVAFGKKAWNKLNPNWQPAELCHFETLNGVNEFSMPSTQNDVFFWIHGLNQNDVFDQVLHIQEAMETLGELRLDLAGFNYRNNMDLFGFEDGTANPKEDERMLAALIPDDKLGAGGCYVLSQKWLHNLKSFKALSDEQQGKVIGRTKYDNIELEGDKMPNDSHISRTDLNIDGQAMKIYRRSDPYGNATEHGLYFLAFSCEMKRFSSQLESMLGMTEDGVHDKLIEFSKAVNSSYWFAPSVVDLHSMLSNVD